MNPEAKPPEIPGLVKIVFDYPFDIGIPPMFFPVVVNGFEEIGAIRVTRFEGVQTFDKGRVLREEISGTEKKIVKVELSDIPKAAPEIVGFGEENIPAFHHVISEKGASSFPWFYSRVEVVFCINDIKSAWATPQNSNFITEMVIKLFNQFLLVYRDVSVDVHNKPLSKEENIALYKELYTSELSEDEKLLNPIQLLSNEFIDKKTFKPFFNNPSPFPLVHGSISTPLKNNIKKKEIGEEQALAFLQKAATPASIPVFNQVLLSSMERLIMDNDPRMTIVDLDTAVEMTVAHYLFLLLGKEGKTFEEIVDLFDDEVEASWKLGKSGYLTTVNRINRLEELFNKKLTSKGSPEIRIKDTEEYKNWHKLVRRRRNAGVHAWHQFDSITARESFNAAQKFVRYLQKIGDELLADTAK